MLKFSANLPVWLRREPVVAQAIVDLLLPADNTSQPPDKVQPPADKSQHTADNKGQPADKIQEPTVHKSPMNVFERDKLIKQQQQQHLQNELQQRQHQQFQEMYRQVVAESFAKQFPTSAMPPPTVLIGPPSRRPLIAASTSLKAPAAAHRTQPTQAPETENHNQTHATATDKPEAKQTAPIAVAQGQRAAAPAAASTTEVEGGGGFSFFTTPGLVGALLGPPLRPGRDLHHSGDDKKQPTEPEAHKPADDAKSGSVDDAKSRSAEKSVSEGGGAGDEVAVRALVGRAANCGSGPTDCGYWGSGSGAGGSAEHVHVKQGMQHGMQAMQHGCVAGCVACAQGRELELSRRAAAAEAASLDLTEMNRVLTLALGEERSRANDAESRVKSLLADRIGRDLASTQHNLASGFPSVNQLKDRYVELMTTGSRQDCIDSIVQLRQHSAVKKQCDTVAKENPDVFNIPLANTTQEFILKLECQVGEIVRDCVISIESLFAQFPLSTSAVILSTMPVDQVTFKQRYERIFPARKSQPFAPLDEPRITELLRESLRTNFRQFFDIIRTTTTPTTTMAANADAKMAMPRSCEAWVEIMSAALGGSGCVINTGTMEAMRLAYRDRVNPMVRFGLDRSSAAQYLVEVFFDCADICQKTMPPLVGAWQKTITHAFEQLERFIMECLEFFWMLNLAVPKVVADLSFDKATLKQLYKVHPFVPLNIRKDIVFESIIFPPLINPADKSILAHGLAV